MAGFGRATGLVATGALTLALVACSSMGGLAPPPGTELARADLAAATFIVDLPVTVEPGPAPRVTYGAALDATLVPTDAEAVMPLLPAPAEGRSYAVYAFAEADREAVRAALGWAGTATLVVDPGICLTTAARKSSDRLSVLAIVPGSPPVTLFGPETLSALEGRIGRALAPCAGHSG